MEPTDAGSTEVTSPSRHDDQTDRMQIGRTDTPTARGARSPLAFFIPDLALGGAEQVTVNIVNGLTTRGYSVDLLLSRAEGKLQTELAPGVNVIELPPTRTSVFGVAAHLPALVRYLQQKNPTVLFPHLAHVSIVCLALNRMLDIDTTVVPTHHKAFGIESDQTAKDRIVQNLIPLLYPSADRIIAVSEGVADSIVKGTPVNRTDVSVLHNPINVEAIRERARDPVNHEWIEDDELDVVLFVGRLEGQKDLRTWLRAFRIVHEQNPNTRAVIAGQGSLRSDLLSVADRLDIADVVSMPGYVENPYRYMSQASVFVLSSQYEGLPTVLIEALACGCPVVATDCPSGPREILADGKYGPLVPVGEIADLADAVDEILADPVPSDTLRARADEFDTESALDNYETFIEEYLLSD